MIKSKKKDENLEIDCFKWSFILFLRVGEKMRAKREGDEEFINKDHEMLGGFSGFVGVFLKECTCLGVLIALNALCRKQGLQLPQ